MDALQQWKPRQFAVQKQTSILCQDVSKPRRVDICPNLIAKSTQGFSMAAWW
jgi:hypothetical protein